MKLFITTVLSSLAFSVAAQGYVVSPDSQPVRDSSGQCVRTASWTPADRTAPCDPVPVISTASINADVLFGFDKSTLTAAGAAQLKSLATAIKPKSKVVIIGHADAIGEPIYNHLLSEARAAVVADFLHKLVDAEFDPLGVGSTHPLPQTAKCASIKNFSQKVACYAPDRRVEIIYTKL